MKKWLKALAHVAPKVLELTPLKNIAKPVEDLIGEAEAMPGASGHEKLAHVVKGAVHAAEIAQASGVHIDPQAVEQAAEKTVSAAVDITNIAAGVKEPAA